MLYITYMLSHMEILKNTRTAFKIDTLGGGGGDKHRTGFFFFNLSFKNIFLCNKYTEKQVNHN